MTSPYTGGGRGTYGSPVNRSKRNGGPMRMLHKKSQEEPTVWGQLYKKEQKKGKVGHFRALHKEKRKRSPIEHVYKQTDKNEIRVGSMVGDSGEGRGVEGISPHSM